MSSSVPPISVDGKYRTGLQCGLEDYLERTGLQLSAAVRVRTGDRPGARFQVGRFKMAISIHTDSNRSLNQDTKYLFPDLFSLSKLFIRQIGMDHDHPGINVVKSVVDKAVEFIPG